MQGLSAYIKVDPIFIRINNQKIGIEMKEDKLIIQCSGIKIKPSKENWIIEIYLKDKSIAVVVSNNIFINEQLMHFLNGEIITSYSDLLAILEKIRSKDKSRIYCDRIKIFNDRKYVDILLRYFKLSPNQTTTYLTSERN